VENSLFGAVIQCLIASKFTILALVALNVFGLAQQMYWKWFLGMVVKPVRLPHLHAQKTV
jgi:hypothetical protein